MQDFYLKWNIFTVEHCCLYFIEGSEYFFDHCLTHVVS